MRDKLSVLGTGIGTAGIIFAFEQVATTKAGKTILERAVERVFGVGSDHTVIIPSCGHGSKSIPNELARVAEEEARKDGKVVNYGRKQKHRGRLFRTK